MLKAKEKLYFLSILLYLLPSFNLFIIYSHGVAKLLSIFLLFFNLVNLKKKFKKITPFFTLFTLFSLTQSVSIINVIDIESFLNIYKNFLFIIIFFINSYFYFLDGRLSEKSKIRYFFSPLFFPAVFTIFCQILIFFFPDLFLMASSPFLYSGYFKRIKMNIERGRIFFDSYEQVFIPLIFYFLFYLKRGQKKHTKHYFSFFLALLLITISLISFLTNFRVKFLMFLFSTFCSLVIFKKLIKRKLFIYFFLLLSFVFFTLEITKLRSTINIFDRFYLINEPQERSSINFRLIQINDAWDVFIKKPFFGVGLGNYWYYTSHQKVKSFDIFYYYYKELLEIDKADIHNIIFNILTETGVFGFTSFLSILIYFIYLDLSIIKKGKDLFKESTIIAFWALFIYSLFNPTNSSFPYNILFWYLRFIIEFIEIKDGQ